MPTTDEIKYQNNTFCDMIDNDGLRKQAEDDAGEYIRLKLREEGFSRKIIEPIEIGDNDIDQAVWTDKPIKIYQKESDIQAAVSVGYSNQPINFYIRPSKFIVTPTMLITPKVQKHKWELRTYKYDVREVFADNMVKDMQAMEDKALLSAVNVALIGPNSTMPFSGVAQYKQISGGFSRSSVVTSCFQVLQQTQFNIPVETNLINNITWAERLRWRRDEGGGDISEKWLLKGNMETDLFGQNWLVTIKRGLVGNLVHYLFGPTKFLGKSCLFTPPTMYVDVKHVSIYSFFAVEEIGTSLAHTGAFGRVDYLSA